MPKTKIDIIKGLIYRSLLLSAERKNVLLKKLPSLNTTQLQKLQTILKFEGKFMETLTERTVSSAVKGGDTKFLNKLDTFLFKSEKKIRKSEEGAEHQLEEENIEHIFDDTNT